MTTNFSIKSKNFSLYKAFREEAEKYGWIYNESFTPFNEDQSNRCNCLFFCSKWFCIDKPMFSFSNSTSTVYNLPEQWDAAIEHMKYVIGNCNMKSDKTPVSISLAQLAEQHGVEVDRIVITA